MAKTMHHVMLTVTLVSISVLILTTQAMPLDIEVPSGDVHADKGDLDVMMADTAWPRRRPPPPPSHRRYNEVLDKVPPMSSSVKDKKVKKRRRRHHNKKLHEILRKRMSRAERLLGSRSKEIYDGMADMNAKVRHQFSVLVQDMTAAVQKIWAQLDGLTTNVNTMDKKYQRQVAGLWKEAKKLSGG